MKTAWKIALLALLILPSALCADEPKEIPLWPNGAPGSEGKTDPERVEKSPTGSLKVFSIHNPSITPYLPPKEKATGAAVVILPGGGHRELNVSSEGYDVAQWLSEHGVAGFVLKYRLAREPGSTYKWDVHGFQDTQRALRLVRSHAGEWGIDPERVGVLGFSAGGELAALAAMRFKEMPEGSSDPVDQQNAKPTFQGLIYPGTPWRIVPTKESPPAFMAIGFDDPSVAPLAKVFPLFKEVGVPAELHIYAGAGHPTGFRPKDNTPASKWRERFYEWLDDRGFLTKPGPNK
jgi:endo-1,4-beta-xylanase